MIKRFIERWFPRLVNSWRDEGVEEKKIELTAHLAVKRVQAERLLMEAAQQKIQVNFDNEYSHMLGFTDKLTTDDKAAMRLIVNQESYSAVRKYVRTQALNFFREARDQKNANISVVINQIGNAYLNLIAEIDSLFLGKEEDEAPYNNYLV